MTLAGSFSAVVACKSIHCVLHLGSIAEYVLSTPVFWKPDIHTRSVRHDWVCVRPNANHPPLVMSICHTSSAIQNRRQAEGPPDLASLSLSSLAADMISIVDQHYQTTSIDYLHTYSLACILLDSAIFHVWILSLPYQINQIYTSTHQAKINNHRTMPTELTSPCLVGKPSIVARTRSEYPPDFQEWISTDRNPQNSTLIAHHSDHPEKYLRHP